MTSADALMQGQDMVVRPSVAARLLGVNSETVKRWSLAGKLTPIRTIGGHRRYRESQLRQILSGELGQAQLLSESEVTQLRAWRRLRLLRVLSDGVEWAARDVAAAADVPAESTVYLLSRMSEKHLVRSLPNGNGKARLYVISDAGIRFLDAAS